MDTDRQYMERALELAERGRGRTSPNPMVGCVIVRDGKIIGEGFHEKAGQPHAEVRALDAAGDIARSTVYVTLEPCCHQGRTPPCADILKEKRPARLVAAMEDPNPQVAGKGFAALRDADIEVNVGVLEQPARRLNEAFVKYVTTRLPFVIAKCGMSLDGKIATRTGDSRWVTSEASRQFAHQLRDQVDAILVGGRTVLRDDPQLTTRIPGGDGRDPIRILLSSGKPFDTARKVFHLDSTAPTWLVVPDDSDQGDADDVIRVPRVGVGLDLYALMKELGKREVTSVLIEGGGATHAAAFEAGIVDKVMFFVAPKIVGGAAATTVVGGTGAETMSDAIALTDMTARPVGDDILIEAYVRGT